MFDVFVILTVSQNVGPIMHTRHGRVEQKRWASLYKGRHFFGLRETMVQMNEAANEMPSKA